MQSNWKQRLKRQLKDFLLTALAYFIVLGLIAFMVWLFGVKFGMIETIARNYHDCQQYRNMQLGDIPARCARYFYPSYPYGS